MYYYLCALSLLFLIMEEERCLQRRSVGSSSVFKKWREGAQLLLVPLQIFFIPCLSLPPPSQPVVTMPEIWTCLSAQWRPPASWRIDNSWSLALGSGITLRHLKARWLWSPSDSHGEVCKYAPLVTVIRRICLLQFPFSQTQGALWVSWSLPGWCGIHSGGRITDTSLLLFSC